MRKQDVRENEEAAFAIHQSAFATLAKLRKGPVELWWHMLKLMECESPWSHLPSKLKADARSLVEVGLVLEDEKGRFRINPEMAYISHEPRIKELS